MYDLTEKIEELIEWIMKEYSLSRIKAEQEIINYLNCE